MPTLDKYFHVIVFAILAFLTIFLQLGPHSKGYPIPVDWDISRIVTLRIMINGIPALCILSICMIPFGYDTTRKLSIASLMFLTLATCLTTAILTPVYLNNYHAGEHAIIIAVSSLALNGVVHYLRGVVENNVQLPQRLDGRPQKTDHEAG